MSRYGSDAEISGSIEVSGSAIFNEGSLDADFRVESDSNTHMLYVDAGNNRVGIGTDNPSATLHVSSSGDTSLIIEGKQDVALGLVADIDNAGGEDQNPFLYMSQETTTAGAYQFLMGIEGTADLSYVGSYTNQPFILSKNSEQQGLRTFQIATDNGSDVSSRFSIATGGRIAIGDAVQAADARLHIKETTTTDVLLLETTENSSTASPVFKMKRNSSSPADADYLGQIKFAGENDADQEVNYAKITGKISDASDGAEDGIIEFANIKAGSQTITARLRHDSFQLLNSTNLSVNGTTTLEGAVSFPDVLITELSIPNIDVQANTNAFRFNCPYGLTVTGLRLDLDQHTTSGDVTVTVTNSTDSNTMITLSVTGTNLSANTTTVSNASADQGDIITFAITATPANAQGLRATLEFKRDL